MGRAVVAGGPGTPPTGAGSGLVIRDLLAGLRNPVQRFEPGGSNNTSPAVAWALQSGADQTAVVLTLPA